MTIGVVIAAGGTGGHLLPGIAVASAIAARRPDVAISFIGTPYGMESELVPAAGYRVHTTNVRAVRSKASAPGALWSVLPATRAARAILRREGARVVIGMGGYPSVPVVLAARLSRIPVLIHEANAIPGLANDLAARVTPNIAVTFPQTAARFPRRRPRVTGMPLRPEIVAFDRARLRPEAHAAFGLDPDRPVVLALGGSLGAASLTEAMLAAAESWPGAQVLLSAGRAHADAVAARAPGSVRVEAFIDRMDLAYAAADVIVARAGASSVCEIAAVGLPSVLVPLPIARRREQHANAAWLVDAGAAVMIEDAQLAERLAPAVAGLLADEEARGRMGTAARGAARTDAAETIAAWALDLAEGR